MCVKGCVIFANEEEKCPKKKKKFICVANGKVSQSTKRRFIYLFIFKNEVVVLRVQLATNTTFSEQNLSDKLLMICKKVMSFVSLDKNKLKLAT